MRVKNPRVESIYANWYSRDATMSWSIRATLPAFSVRASSLPRSNVAHAVRVCRQRRAGVIAHFQRPNKVEAAIYQLLRGERAVLG